MELKTILTKRWFGYFALLFIVWYPVSFLIVTMYNILQHPIFLFVGNVFTPLWILLVSFLYFRKACDDWTARFVTAIGWMLLLFLFSAILLQPVYGYPWTTLFTWNVINANWVNFIAILVGGVAAHKTGLATERR
ncbi:hypothetical protein EPN81_02275 [Patescibacteria group bacterium]|nr:MAG: hypothetical protein EPN81_02275 [Patescibacteria group bacterium]